MTVSFITLGCKVNQYESVALLELFDKKKQQLLETICNLDNARKLIMGEKSMVNVSFYEIVR